MKNPLSALATVAGSALLAGAVLASPALAATPHRATVRCADVSAGAASQAQSQSPSLVDHHLAGGGSKYVYDIGSQQLSFPVLPAGFNARTASQAQLAQYGLPAEPTNPTERTAWLDIVDAMHRQSAPDLQVGHVPTDTATSSALSPAATPGSAAGSASSTGGFGGVSQASTNIWSGYVSYLPGQSTHYENAQGIWDQPSIGKTSCSGATHLTWVGLGGFNTSELLQTGTNQNDQAWYEWLGPNGVPIQIFPQNLTVRTGDSVEAWAIYLPPASGNGSGIGWFELYDVTTNQVTVAFLSNAQQDWNGSSAEFVDERTSFPSGPSPLANYGETKWTYAGAASATDTSDHALATLGGVDQLTMVNSSDNHVLATAGNEGPSGYAFITHWNNCS